jgi:hypothetical protein
MRVKHGAVILMPILLNRPRRLNALSYLLRKFTAPLVCQVLVFQPWRFKMYVDPV